MIEWTSISEFEGGSGEYLGWLDLSNEGILPLAWPLTYDASTRQWYWNGLPGYTLRMYQPDAFITHFAIINAPTDYAQAYAQ